MFAGSLNVLHKNTILESMDYFISKLTKDYNKLIKPKIAEHLSNYIRTYLYVYRYLYRSYEMVCEHPIGTDARELFSIF